MALPEKPPSQVTTIVSVVVPALLPPPMMLLCATTNAPHDAAARQQHSSQRRRKSRKARATWQRSHAGLASCVMRRVVHRTDGHDIDFKEYGGWLAAVLGCPTRDLRELGRVCDIGEPYELRESGRREGGRAAQGTQDGRKAQREQQREEAAPSLPRPFRSTHLTLPFHRPSVPAPHNRDISTEASRPRPLTHRCSQRRRTLTSWHHWPCRPRCQSQNTRRRCKAIRQRIDAMP